MNETTKLIVAALGAGVASNMLLAGPVAGVTSGQPMMAAGAEGLLALGAGWYAWKRKNVLGAIVAGAAAGLFVSSVQSGALSAPAAPAPKAGGAPPAKPGSALPVLPGQVNPGFGTASGPVTVNDGSSLPGLSGVTPATATAATAGFAGAVINDITGGALTDIGGYVGGLGSDSADQSGAAARLGMGPRRSRRF